VHSDALVQFFVLFHDFHEFLNDLVVRAGSVGKLEPVNCDTSLFELTGVVERLIQADDASNSELLKCPDNFAWLLTGIIRTVSGAWAGEGHNSAGHDPAAVKLRKLLESIGVHPLVVDANL
jgi:hypothetical protein